MNQVGYGASGAGLDVRNVFTINSQISVHTARARVRRGSTGFKVVDNSQVCANSLEFYIEANII